MSRFQSLFSAPAPQIPAPVIRVLDRDYPVRDYIAASLFAIQEKGFVSWTMRGASTPATSIQAVRLLSEGKPPDSFYEEVEAALHWMKTDLQEDAKDDFTDRIFLIAHQESVAEEDASMLTYACSLWLRRYAGYIGKPLDILVKNLQCTDVTFLLDGTRRLCFKDEEGHLYTWITQSKVFMQVGSTYQRQFIVKKHVVFAKKKHTLINYLCALNTIDLVQKQAELRRRP